MSNLSESQRIRISAKSSNRCFYCGQDLTGLKFHVDHFNPFSISKNGTSSNLVAACIRCNKIKANLSIEEFRQAISIIAGELPEFFFETHGIVLIDNYSVYTKLLMPKIY